MTTTAVEVCSGGHILAPPLGVTHTLDVRLPLIKHTVLPSPPRSYCCGDHHLGMATRATMAAATDQARCVAVMALKPSTAQVSVD